MRRSTIFAPSRRASSAAPRCPLSLTYHYIKPQLARANHRTSELKLAPAR
jgi:hypothetical protein